jgi:glycosyltransferase involved in cell wall biosynthesis
VAYLNRRISNLKANGEVLIIGNFGYKGNQLDGQTVKTRNIGLLLEEMGYRKIKTIDTSYKLNVLKLFQIIFKKRLIIFVGAENAFKYLLPFISKAAAFSKSEIHYFHIGNVLLDILEENPKRLKLLHDLKMNYPETKGMADKLRNLGLRNLEVIPNFRVTKELNLKDKKRTDGKIRLVYLGRILKEKGIDLILEAHEMLKEEFEKGKIEIDFYGQIVDQNLKFEEALGARMGLNYKGFLNPDKVTSTLAEYDALLFPTYFHEEGFPGTILDAYLAGIPVMASDWMYNAELVENDVDGLLFEPKSPSALADSMLKLLNNPEKLTELKIKAIEKGKALDYKQVKKTFIKHVSKKFKP